MKKVLLIRIGELALKGLNRKSFENRLAKNIRIRLKGFSDFRLISSQSRFYIEPYYSDFDFDNAMEHLSTVPGIVSISPAYKTESDMDTILHDIAVLTEEKIGHMSSDIPFRVKVRRGNKNFIHDSQEIAKIAGEHLRKRFDGRLHVDLESPDLTVHIEVREDTYIYTDITGSVGGLPVGTGGRAMLLLSGGIDSPVAGYMVSKRGVKIEAVHFHSYPFTSERSKMKVIELSKIIGAYNNGIVLHIVPFTDIQLYIKNTFDIEYLTLLIRRQMMAISSKIAEERNCSALITGESIGQVASQTLESLTVTGDSADRLVIRPLIALDKNEIVRIARSIGTYETSIQPYEDCCTLFVAKHPKTRPRMNEIEELERGYDNIDELAEKAISSREIIKL